MSRDDANRLKVFAGRNSVELARRVCQHLDIPLGQARTEEFPDGELIVKLDEDVRGRDCFVISYSPSERGYEGIFAIRGSADGVKLYFNQGKELPDPEKLLKGSGNQARSMNVDDASILDSPAVARLIEEAIARNPVPFAGSGHG